MRTLGIIAAVVIGAFTGMLMAGLALLAFSANDSAQQYGTLLGAVIGGIGLAWLVARLVPSKPSRLRDRGVERMRQR